MASKRFKTDDVAANHEIDDGTRHHHLARRRDALDTLCRVNGGPAYIIAPELYFTGVKPGSNSNTRRSNLASESAGALDRATRPIESGKHSVTG